jgi:hypothetical protein
VQKRSSFHHAALNAVLPRGIQPAAGCFPIPTPTLLKAES